MTSQLVDVATYAGPASTTHRSPKGRWRPWLMVAVPTLFLGVLVVWPLTAVMIRSLTGVSWSDAADVVWRARTGRVLAFTLAQAIISVLLTMVCGLPVAYVLARYRFVGRGLVQAIVLVPFVLPTVVVASAFVQVTNRLGLSISDPTVGLVAIVAAHVFFNVAVVVWVVGGYWEQTDDRPREAAAVLGAGPWRQFRSVTLPRLFPVVVSAGAVVFLFSFTSFGVIRVLGGPRRATLETEIYRYAVSRGEFDVAAVLGLIQIVAVAMMAVTSIRWQRRAAAASRQGRNSRSWQRAAGWWPRVQLVAAVGLVFAVVGLPLVVMVEGSLSVSGGTHYGFDHYRALAEGQRLLPVSALRALATSLLFALVAGVVAVVVGLITAWLVSFGGRASRPFEVLSLVPLGVSAVTLGFGYVVGFAAFDLRRSVWLVPLAHAVVGLPFVLASVTPAMRAINPRVREAAAVLGAGPGSVRRLVDWPLVRPAVLVGAGFALAVSIGEFGATSFVARGDDSFTAPMAVFRLISQPGETLQGQALALSVVISALTAGLAASLIGLSRVDWSQLGSRSPLDQEVR